MRIAVIGLGYVGLPLALQLAKKGFSVVGVDINQRIIDEIKVGRSTIEGISPEQILEAVRVNQTLMPLKVDAEPNNNTAETLKALVGIDVFIICVQTPLHRERGWEPETHWIRKSAQLICRIGEEEEKSSRLPRERLIILESTTYPGTTRTIFSKVCERFSQKGTQCLLAYSPERTSPGPNSHGDPIGQAASGTSTFEITRIVGGADEVSCETARALYQTIFRRVHSVESLEAAELIKLVENTFRFISIGFANEMARVSRSFGLNIWDIIEAVKTKGFGLDLCLPGLIGGHCLPIDPHYLGWAYRNRRSIATFVDVAERSHQDARRDALDLIIRLLSQHDKGVPKSSILFFGVAYKKDVGDIRESGVLDLMKKLYSYGARLSFWDPVRARQSVKHDLHLNFSEAERRQLSKPALERLVEQPDGQSFVKPQELDGDWKSVRDKVLGTDFDCVVLATDHTDFHSAYTELFSSKNSPPVVDINNAAEFWLRTAELTSAQRDEIKQTMHDRSRYMLFGHN